MTLIFAVAESGYKIFAPPHIEEPKTEFPVEFDFLGRSHILRFVPGTRWVRVWAQTEAGALQIAAYHYFRTGRNFRLKPKVAITKVPLAGLLLFRPARLIRFHRAGFSFFRAE